ncbi:MAG: methyltransferase regulatory domain-containing protein [Planctomycetales bacterium]|nr:methyltransferase regulatory domain-containing protein [Planctomycetales bacterium]
MLSLAADTRIFVAAGATDMRKGFDGLQGGLYALFLNQELAEMRYWEDGYFRHDSLEEHNEPVYFHEFVERAEAHRLRYLAESEFPTMLIDRMSSTASSTLELVATSQVDLEQYMDFVGNRMFRQTLLCHRDVPLTRSVSADCVKRLHIAAKLSAADGDERIADRNPIQFLGDDGNGLTVRRPLLKSALIVLRELWPRNISFAELMEKAASRLGAAAGNSAADTDEDSLATMVLTAYSADLVRLSSGPLPLTHVVSERPRTSPLARLQATSNRAITTQLHEDIDLNADDRRLIQVLDGTRDMARIVSELNVANSDTHIVSRLQRFAKLALLTG